MGKLYATIMLIFMTGSVNSQVMADQGKAITWHEWSDEAFELAQAQNKLVLLDISARWCQFCKKMKAVTYTDPGVIKIINDSYIAINADIELTMDVKMLYGDFGVPGTVILTPERDEMNKRLGYIPPQQMQWHLLGSLQDAPDFIAHPPPPMK